MNVLILAGGISNEHDVSVRSGQSVSEAIRKLGHDITEADPSAEDFDLVTLVTGADVVFLALHGKGGEDGVLQTQLEQLGVPFVGTGSRASALCFDKSAYKRLLKENDLPASIGEEVELADITKELFDKPYVLKPIEGGSSLDTQIVRSPTEQYRREAKELLSRYPKMLLEELIEGTEITIGILDQEPLPVIEIVPPEGLEFDYENKYNGATQELCPPVTVSLDKQKEAQELALKIHNLTGCRDMSRTDMMIDQNGKLHVLETNTIPGLTNQSLLPKMAKEAGYTMPQFVDKLLELALKR
jgi:D-alanine-D-alanine ligase